MSSFHQYGLRSLGGGTYVFVYTCYRVRSLLSCQHALRELHHLVSPES